MHAPAPEPQLPPAAVGPAAVGGRPQGWRERLEARLPLVVWAVVLVTLCWVPLKVISCGFLPRDDALRYAAKAVSGKTWAEVLLLRPGVLLDHNPGWNWILSRVHALTGCGADALVVVAVLGLWLLFNLSALPWLRRPESWLLALLTCVVCRPGMVSRLALGRPFLFSTAALVVLLLVWERAEESNRGLVGRRLLSVGLFFGAAWIHGSWYLFALLVGAFYAAGQWRKGHELLGCWAGGTVLGALVTGHPLEFLFAETHIWFQTFGEHVLQRFLVSEYQPADGAFPVLVAVLGVLLLRRVVGQTVSQPLASPALMLGAVAWLLGFRVGRVWNDWGMPAIAVWLTLQFEDLLGQWQPPRALGRLYATGFCALGLFWAATNDVNGRWTMNLTRQYLSAEDPGIAPWLPEPGGIVYDDDMLVFYGMFFKNPNAPWRYVLGFEPTFMPEEDLRIYRNIQWNYGAWKAYAPWVAKMRPPDRMILETGYNHPPGIEGLEWHYAATDTWVGRLPRPQRTGHAAATRP